MTNVVAAPQVRSHHRALRRWRKFEGLIVAMFLAALFSPLNEQPSSINSGASQMKDGTNAVAEQKRQIFIPQPSESIIYDPATGNCTSDSQWTYTWNPTGQLTAADESNPPTGVPARHIAFTYDGFGRRVEKDVSQGGTLVRKTTYLWNGDLPVREIETNGTGGEQARRVYTWGPDASGQIDGAGGIGGLVEVLETKAGVTTKSLPIYDGFRNVIGLVDGTTGARVATYMMGPFGELLGESGTRITTCPLRFQNQYYDEDLGLTYFGARWLRSKTRSWMSLDPEHKVPFYDYCAGDPLGKMDPWGLETKDADDIAYQQWHAANLARLRRDHPWIGFIVGLTGFATDVSGMNGQVAQLQAIGSPFVMAASVTDLTAAEPEEIRATGAQILDQISTPYGLAEAGGGLTFMALTGSAGFDMPNVRLPSTLEAPALFGRYLPHARERGMVNLPFGNFPKKSFITATERRYTPGIVTVSVPLPTLSGKWLDASVPSPIPAQVAAKLVGLRFNSFPELRSAIWEAVAAEADLIGAFSPANLANIRAGNAPFAPKAFQTNLSEAGLRFNLHHIESIEAGGDVYDLGNLQITSPAIHLDLH